MKPKFYRFRQYFGHVLSSLSGRYQRAFDERWDRQLNKLLRDGVIESVGKHTVIFSCGDNLFEVWIANRWYAYAYLCELNGEAVPGELQARPRFRTMLELHELASAFSCRPQSSDEFFKLLDWMLKEHD